MKSNQNKKKILFLITKSNWGGAQRYVYDLATSLPSEQYECVVGLGGTGELYDKLCDAGVRVVSIDSLQRDISFAKEISTLYHTANLIRHEDPDILHINSSKAGFIGSFLGRILFIPRVVFTAHGWAFNEDRGFVSRFIIKFIHYLTVLMAHKTIAVSKAVKKQMNWPGAQKSIDVRHLGINASVMYEKKEAREKLINHLPALDLFSNDIWTMTIAELHPVKQHHITIQAMAAVVKEHPKTRHIIVGSGQAEEELKQEVQRLHLQEHIFFTGHLTTASQYLKAADIFILSSGSEALGYVVLEAAAAGLPIIASDVGGIPEIITHKQNGLLFPSTDTKSLAGNILVLLQDPALLKFFGTKAQQRSLHFTKKQMVHKTSDIYTDAVYLPKIINPSDTAI